MTLILMMLAAMAAGGVVKALYQMRLQAKEQRQKKEALECFEREHPCR